MFKIYDDEFKRLLNLQEYIKKPGMNTPGARKITDTIIKHIFQKLDDKKISRPVDFNIEIDYKNDSLNIYYSKDYTDDYS